MKNIDRRFEELRQRREKALALFVTVGIPKADSTPGLVRAFEEGGADFVELGLPFSDPLADGPVIQESSVRALANGVTLESVLDDVHTIRQFSDIPILLMGYLNPIMRFGDNNFFADAGRAGVDGVILPEVPFEEYDRFARAIHRNGLAGILLVTPASSPERIRSIDAATSGFLYCVSTTGVTGQQVNHTPAGYLRQVRLHAVNHPLMVGFGISNPENARKYASLADGVIVGSALIRFLKSDPSHKAIVEWVRGYKHALRERS
jgi:tryptophan synthase alpha chain